MTSTGSITVTALLAGLAMSAGALLVIAAAIMTGVQVSSATAMAVGALGLSLEVFGYVLSRPDT